MSLEILTTSPFTTMQDLGRFGYQRFGVPTSGAMDWFAQRTANELVLNDPHCATLEIGLTDLRFVTHEACVAAVCGASVKLTVNDHPRAAWTAIYLRKGWEIKIETLTAGSWAYLALSGGLRTPILLGSRSTYHRGNFGRSLQVGDQIQLGESNFNLDRVGRTLPSEKHPRYDSEIIEVIMNPQAGLLTQESVQKFLTSPYRLTANSDRMGYRLEGAALQHRITADIISDGMVLGAIQVPANGQPIVMMSDHATAGGYPKIATVVSADIPVVAQKLSARSALRFKETTVENAQERYRMMMKNIKQVVDPVEENYFGG
jgi:biotin-dependent carboxylase-like uncharacterized protein